MAYTTYNHMDITVSLVCNTFPCFWETLPKDLFHTNPVKLHTVILNHQSPAGMDTILGSDVLLAAKFFSCYDPGHCNNQTSHFYWDRNRASRCATRPTSMTH